MIGGHIFRKHTHKNNKKLLLFTTNFWKTLKYHLFCRCLSGFSNLGLHTFAQIRSKLAICNSAYFFCWLDNLLGGQFWAMGSFNLLGGQSNLLGGQMPTQLTCYLPRFPHHTQKLNLNLQLSKVSHILGTTSSAAPKWFFVASCCKCTFMPLFLRLITTR